MGGCSSKTVQATNEPVDDSDDFEVPEADPVVRALLVYVDYGFEPAKSQGWCPAGFGDKLDTPENAMMVQALLQDAGVADITLISNLEATKENVVAKIAEVGSRCDQDDIFFFFYSGHGNPMPDDDGDEADGNDEAMCLPSDTGECNQFTWLRDDDFADAVTGVDCGEKLIILDCCHSGTLLDFDKPQWVQQKAISITGCKDAQESAAMGGGTRGGAFTKCLNAAVRAVGDEQVSVGKIYNDVLEQGPNFIPANHQQDITIQCAPSLSPAQMMWPVMIKSKAA